MVPAPRFPYLRMLRLTVRTLLLMVTGFGMLLGYKVNQVRTQRAVVDKVRAIGGYVIYDYRVDRVKPPGPAWLRRFVGDDFFAHVVTVAFVSNDDVRTSSSNADAILGEIASLPKLTSLAIKPCRVTTAGMGALADRASVISALYVTDAKIDEHFLGQIARIKSLRILGLYSCTIDQGARDCLSSMSQLHQLAIVNSDVSEQTIDQIRRALPRCIVESSPE